MQRELHRISIRSGGSVHLAVRYKTISMFRYLKYHYNLKKLFRQKSGIQRSFRTDIKSAYKQKKESKDIDHLKDQEYYELQMLNEEISIMVTDFLVNKANYLFLPIPSRNDDNLWTQCNKISDQYVLTNKGISELRSIIRSNSKEKNEVYVSFLVALTGIIGALTGLVAILTR